MNGGTKTTISVASGVLITVLAAGAVTFVKTSMGSNKETRDAQAQHELSTDAHPVWNEKVNTITKNVDKITGSVEKITENFKKIMLLQERQTISMEHMAEDISELKDGR